MTTFFGEGDPEWNVTYELIIASQSCLGITRTPNLTFRALDLDATADVAKPGSGTRTHELTAGYNFSHNTPVIVIVVISFLFPSLYHTTFSIPES